MADNNNDCKLHQFKRNNYFYGKLMTVDDFKLEQSYHDDKRYLMNRLLHGSGVVCGFDLYSDTPGVSLSSSNDNLEITFNKAGMVIDCCGYEIIVPDGTIKTVINQSGTAELSTNTYLYIRYKEDEGELVAAASSPSSCEGMCTATRIIEDFEILASSDTPPEIKRQCSEDFQFPEKIIDGETKREFTENDGWEKIRDWFQNRTKACQSCADNRKVFFAVIKAEGNKLLIDAENTRKYSLPLSNTKLISELVMCHVSDLGNPHNAKHADLYNILPINPDVDNDDRDKHVSNNDAKKWNSAILTVNDKGPDDKGNFTIGNKDSITLSQNENHKITIGESHSAMPGNPHKTKHGELFNIGQVDPEDSNTTKDKHLSNADAKKWEEHADTRGNPHQTEHANLRNVLQVNPADSNTTKDKHLSNADAKKWEEHADTRGNPHQTEHANLRNVMQVDSADSNTTKDKHLSNADAKKWEEHVKNIGNPHQTEHANLDNVMPVNPADNNEERIKHLSNADAKKWNSSVLKVHNVGPDAKSNITLEQGDNITITPHKEKNKITIASRGGTKCLTGVVIFRNVQAGQSWNSPEIELPPEKIWGIILGIEQKYEGQKGEMVTNVYTGNIFTTYGINLSSQLWNVFSEQSGSTNKLTISLLNQSEGTFEELRIRWWAIMPTEDRGVIDVPPERPEGLEILDETSVINDILAHPNVTIKDIVTRNKKVSEADVEKIINPLIEKKVIKAEGRGAKRKLRLNL